MNRDYKISNDGTIFEITEDGSISKIARIDDNGNISSISETINTQQPQGDTGKYWFFIILFAIAAVILGFLYAEANYNYSLANKDRYEYQNKYENASSATSSLHNEISNLKQELDNVKTELSNLKNKASSAYPVIITDIKIANKYKGGNIEADFGSTIYSSNSMFLTPKIEYYGLSSGTKSLKVKLYRPDGSLSIGSYSTYSYSEDAFFYEGENSYTLNGWGNESKGYWKSGTYRIEIWHENSCLRSKTFTIY